MACLGRLFVCHSNDVCSVSSAKPRPPRVSGHAPRQTANHRRGLSNAQGAVAQPKVDGVHQYQRQCLGDGDDVVALIQQCLMLAVNPWLLAFP